MSDHEVMLALPSRLLSFDLAQRRRAVGSFGDPPEIAPLAPLADSLTRDLAPLLVRALPIPQHKSRLTRIGGRCPIHGTLLDFDPWKPHLHRCASCATDYVGDEHDDWWAMGAQLWTVERAVHAAALFALRGEVAHAALAARILRTLAERYNSWPNRDNVLGPSRPFFSTYLESIWLLNACHALSLLEATSAPEVDALGPFVRERLITPSAALIASYHEGLSNRQVWNEVAILSALHLLGDHAAVQARRTAPDGFTDLLARGLLDDGSWYEGENYHLFAHRGLWYGVELFKATGHAMSADLDARYRAGFLAPFIGVLPDDTFPSRRDSQYGVSIRQWRIAEWCELGYAHSHDPRIAGVLSRIYENAADTGAALHNTALHNTASHHAASRNAVARAHSTADAERNAPPSALTRADLSWRALLMADVSPVPPEAWRIASKCLPGQGLAVLRRDAARTYVALEGGHGGGGHGHPDRLALTLQTGADRWLEDPGAGSYVDRSLHWYRSTLAHSAPLVDGASQQPAPCALLAFEDRGGAGWIWKRTTLTAGCCVDRTVVVADGYLVDLLEWRRSAARGGAEAHVPQASGHRLTLAIAGDASVQSTAAWRPATTNGAGGLEDGFDFAQNVERTDLTGVVALNAHSTRAHASHGAPPAHVATAWYASRGPLSLVRATVPGAPGRGPAQRHWLEVEGDEGCIAGVWNWNECDWPAVVADVVFDLAGAPVIVVRTNDGTRAEHRRAPHGWHIDLQAGHARSSIDLEGLRAIDGAEAIAASDISTDAPPGAQSSRNNNIVLVVHPQRIKAAADADAHSSHSTGAEGGEPGTPIDGAWTGELHEPHYVRTEQSWHEAGAPTAAIQLAAIADTVVIDVHARTGPVVCESAPRDNPLDNERDDVNADGLQLYFRAPAATSWGHAVLVVPSDPAAPRISLLTPSSSASDSFHDILPACRARIMPDGWAMRLVWRRAQLPIDDTGALAFDLIVNERSPDRERRRGQLVLSGGGGFGYLRGDRQDSSHAIRLEFSPAPHTTSVRTSAAAGE